MFWRKQQLDKIKKILAILPHSIGGRLTCESMFNGFKQNNFEVIVFDELKNINFNDYLADKYDYIVGYDFSPIKLKIDYNLEIPCIAYFSDVIYSKTSGAEYDKYYQYLKNDDIYFFYWDRVLAKKENHNYLPHFVDVEIYKNFKNPTYDVGFMGRLDTDLRLNMYLELNKRLPNLKFCYYGIKRHFDDAISRCKSKEDKNILINTYKGFIDNEKDMAKAINELKIVYNINAQGISSLNYRTFQVMACERLLISDKRMELDLFDNILPIYNDIDDLVRKIEFYIKNENEFNEIAKKSREYILNNHNAKKSVEYILKTIKKSE